MIGQPAKHSALKKLRVDDVESSQTKHSWSGLWHPAATGHGSSQTITLDTSTIPISAEITWSSSQQLTKIR